MTAHLNSTSYWNARFGGDWHAHGGREQTRFFAEIALRHLPAWIARDIALNQLSVVDWGCAEGDATEALACALRTSVTGVDIAERAVESAHGRFPHRRFLRSTIDELETYDVLFTSNTLEHFDNPLDILQSLLARIRKYALVLVPFREGKRHEEHFVTFDLNSFPYRIGAFYLLSFDVIDTANLPQTWWGGQQILVIYAHQDAVPPEQQRLSTIGSPWLDELDSLRLTVAESRRELEASHGQLEDAHQELANTQRERAQTQAVLAETQAALAETQAALETTQRERAETQAVLAETQAALETTQREHVETQAVLQTAHRQLEEARAELLRHQRTIADFQGKAGEVADTLQQAAERLRSVAKTKPYRLAHLLRRLERDLIKGSRQEKMQALRWLRRRLVGRQTPREQAQNPLLDTGAVIVEVAGILAGVPTQLGRISPGLEIPTSPARRADGTPIAPARPARRLRRVDRPQGAVALLRAIWWRLTNRDGAATTRPGAAGAATCAAARTPAQPPPAWPYESLRLLKDIEVSVIDQDFDVVERHGAFAAITTVKNEGATLATFLADVGAQTLLPAEFVIVDGGSTDATVAIAQEFVARNSGWARLIVRPGLNIAAGRNVGVRATTAPIVVFVDAGCRLGPRQFANLYGPFAVQRPDVVAGVFEAAHPTKATPWFAPDWARFDGWQSFLPSARSVAVRRQIFDLAGGFPEHLTRTGEDTLFDIACRRFSARWVINKRACVQWDAPTTEAAIFELARLYAAGDGESGIGDFVFRPDEQPPAGSLRGEQVRGYREGRQRRPRIEIERRGIKGIAVILSGVPIVDIGGGQRATQMALEFVRSGHKVMFINLYPRYGEQVDKLFLDIDYTLLELANHSEFDVEEFTRRYAEFDVPVAIVTEFPHPAVLPTVRHLRQHLRRARYFFDCIDLWDSSLGGDWYDPAVERELIDLADHLIASAGTLQAALAARSGRPVHLIANAVNHQLFRPDVRHDRPADMPGRRPCIVYVGSLYGDWFDWDVMSHAVRSVTDCDFVFIGDHRGVGRAAELERTCANVMFLGPKAQRDLPAYLQHAAACVIPFKADSAITRFVNPLKVYEYLAMQRPVIATAMAELVGIPGVSLAVDGADFAARVARAVRGDLDRTQVAAFLAQNTWSDRIGKLVALLHAPICPPGASSR